MVLRPETNDHAASNQERNPDLDKTWRGWQGAGVLRRKLDKLRELLRSYGTCLVAYSGGVDSVLLARVAGEVLGERSLAVVADSPSLPRRELAEAVELGRRFGYAVRVIRTREFEDPEYVRNSPNRCYICKRGLFSELARIARAEGFQVIVCGENASDAGDFRPGTRAAREWDVRAPLHEVGLGKDDIRELSRQLGLPTADKPQMACLSTRIPFGEPVTPEKLRMIEQAEYVLRDMGFHDVRVRHHEMKSDVRSPNSEGSGHLARIEVGASEMTRLFENGMAGRVGEGLRTLGYTHVTLDLLGYRRGSGNPAAAAPEAPGGGGSGETFGGQK
ncbi:MAG: ATP-dependent sacrificial sulfur transferase LarE [Verrucomicrobia bacterium]|nr:ATP-dependent sacrificial sulfur transferase LarE [Verrucomicrobiota bacterium]